MTTYPPLVPARPAGLREHVIICGLDNLGFGIIRQLELIGRPLIVVDPAPPAAFARRVQAQGTPLLEEEARDRATLEAAGIATACALITTFEDDLINLAVVLTAVRLRPDLRLVMRFFNPEYAPTIQAALPNVRVLSLSALAAPAFVAAAVDPWARQAMIVADQVLSIDEIPIAEPGALAARAFDRVAVLAWQQPPAPARLFPPADHPLGAGDRLTVIGAQTGVQALPELLNPQGRPAPAGRAGAGLLLRRLHVLLHNLDPALYLTLGVLAVVIAISAGVFALVRHLGSLDALLLVFGVISTTGIGWFSSPADPIWVKVYVIALMVMGTAALTVIYAFVTNYLVSVKLSGLLGQQPVALQDHIVVCGLGAVGYRVATELRARGEAVAVLELDAANPFLPLVRGRHREARAVVGDARLPESMALVNVAGARCIVCVTNSDMANIQTALNARQLNPRVRVVLGAVDAQTAQQVAETFGLEVALSASALAAPAFVAAALDQTVVQQVRVAGEALAVALLRVSAGSPAAGAPLAHLLGGRPAAVLYHTPAGGARTYRPADQTALGEGDALLIVAGEAALQEISARLAPAGVRAGGKDVSA